MRRDFRRYMKHGLLVWLMAVGPIVGEDNPTGQVDPVSISDLVQQLGAEQFLQRQLATESLCSIGMAAEESLSRATASRDPEVRTRARAILRVIRHDHRKRLVDAFIAGRDSGREDTLPGWSHLRTIVGDDSLARQLYVRMLIREWMFLDAVYRSDRAKVPRLLERHYHSMNHAAGRPIRQISLGRYAAIVLASAREGVQISANTSILLLRHRTEDFDAEFRVGKHRQALRRLFAYLVSRPVPDLHLHQVFDFSLEYDIKESLPVARSVLAERRGRPLARQSALLLIGKLGDAGDLQWAHHALYDQAVITTHKRIRGRTYTTQVCDVALAVLVERHQEDFSRYGLPHVRPHDEKYLYHSSIGFATQQERETAISDWGNRTSGSLHLNQRPASGRSGAE